MANRMKIRDRISQKRLSKHQRTQAVKSYLTRLIHRILLFLALSEYPLFQSMQNFLSEKTFQKTERFKKEVAQYFASKPVIFFKKLSERPNIWNGRGKILVHVY
jgi:hypothetical protein